VDRLTEVDTGFDGRVTGTVAGTLYGW